MVCQGITEGCLPPSLLEWRMRGLHGHIPPPGLSLLVGLLQWFLGGDISVLPCMTCTMAAGVEDGRSTSVWGGGGAY